MRMLLAATCLVPLGFLGLLGCHHDAPSPAVPAPPPIATCEEAWTHARDLEQAAHPDEPDRISAVANVTRARCTGDAWSPDSRNCFARGADEKAETLCFEGLSEAQRTAVETAMEPAAKPRADAKAPVATASNIPQSCLDYKAIMEQFYACDKIPQAARDAAKEGFDQTWTAWTTMPPEALAALADACKVAADSARSMTCPP